MKFLHVADLHFGKSLHERSLLPDQRDWAEKFVALVKEIRPDAVVVAGDVYDRAAPSGEAVELLDRFLTDLLACDGRLSVLMVAGNHDSAPRLAFGAEILAKQRLYVAGRTEKAVKRVVLSDRHGEVVFHLLPFTFPAAIAQALGEEETAKSYTEAMARYLAAQNLDPAARNVLVAHQNVSCGGRDAERGGSETMIGGVGGIDVATFDEFDYVALGHIHKAQRIGRNAVRYAGSPLCYAFDETRFPDKGALLVEMGEKGAVAVEQIPIPPLHPLRVVEGAFEDIVAGETANSARGEYLKVVLTDRKVDPASGDALRALFKSKGSEVLRLISDFHDAAPLNGEPAEADGPEPTLDERFAAFWRAFHGGEDPDGETTSLLREAARQLDEGRTDAAALAAFACGRGRA